MPDEPAPLPRHVALLMWGDVVEDYLDPIGWTLDDFLERMSGGWLFGYISALSRRGIRSTLVLFTRDAPATSTRMHAPTGTRVRLIASPWTYRMLRAFVRSPYHWLDDAGRVEVNVSWPLAPLYVAASDAMPYLATPTRALVGVLRDERCDAILCQEYEEPRFDAAIAAGEALGIPVFATFQGARARRSRKEEARRLQSMARAHGFAIGSSREAARVRQRYNVQPSRIVRAFNPIDASTWFPEPVTGIRHSLGIPDGAFLVAWHGRVAMVHKGLDLLLRAWDTARARIPALHLLLVGSGEDASRLSELLAARAPSGDVTWVDRYIADRPTMRRYLSAADAWVLPSRYEGFAVAPLEAMACGLPIVATDVEGIADLAPRGADDGIVSVPVNDERALADALVRIASDAGLRDRMRAGGQRRIAESFTTDAVAGQLVQLLSLPAPR